ncbi:MAG: hypothetical protein HY669_04770 [Chloroflexi bacterium]|nr:hypothetical protein [Chloroflexota bacterium]
MKTKLLLFVTILTIVLSALMPSVALAAPPTQFSAIVIPTNIQLLSETPLGHSGRLLAKEQVTGFIPYSTWSLLSYATAEMDATTNYIELPTGERKGVMRGRMVITSWNPDYTVAGTLELTYVARISGPGGMTFEGNWTAVHKTGVFKGINARGRFFSDPAQHIPPTLVGTYK